MESKCDIAYRFINEALVVLVLMFYDSFKHLLSLTSALFIEYSLWKSIQTAVHSSFDLRQVSFAFCSPDLLKRSAQTGYSLPSRSLVI